MGEALFIELGSEEIPAGYIQPALEAMSQMMTRFLDESRISHGEPYIAGTPRRLMLHIPDVDLHQEAATTEVVGPPKAVAFDAEGRPTKAAEGFARGQGVGVDQIHIKTTPKGDYLVILREETGSPTREILEKMLPDFVARIPFPKSMRWGAETVTFARPLRWIVAMLGKQVLDFTYGDIRSGNFSFGHRFLSPSRIDVSDFGSHMKNLAEAHVIADFGRRRALIADAIVEAAARVGGRILEDEELLDEVTQILEFPYPVVGEFEEKYLKLPPEVLITVIKKHQRYFAVIDSAGKLMRHFVTVSNTVPRDPVVVAAGNARVVRARLDDARFYYEEDQKHRLEQRAEQLKGVVFHAKLGTSWEKAERFTAIAKKIAGRIAPDLTPDVERAAFLCKADLVTGIVSEFPDLQGVMGRTYARLQGESEAVSDAIYEHYLPTRAGGPIPSGTVGAILSIADKIDTIVACFGVGLIPTGTTDPFALRRQTLGIIRIVLEKPFRLSLSELIDDARAGLESKLTEPWDDVRRAVLDFFQGRLLHQLVTQEGYSQDVVDAALSVGIDDMVDAAARVKALAEIRRRPDFDSMAAAFKRVENIIKEPETSPVDPGAFQNAAEQALYTALLEAETTASDAVARADYRIALEVAARLKPEIDTFFDSVLVMDRDENVRRNRLAILTRVHGLFSRVADFRKIQTA